MANPYNHETNAQPDEKPSQHNASALPSLEELATRAFTSWLDAVEEPSALSAEVRQARRLCGQFFALRRMNEYLTLEQVRNGTGIPVLTLLDLETGQVKADAVPDELWYRLCLVLNPQSDELATLGAALQIALGREAVPSALVMQDVLEYVEREFAVPSEAVTVAAPVAVAPVEQPQHVFADAPAVLSLDTGKLLILRALKKSAVPGAKQATINSIKALVGVESRDELFLGLATIHHSLDLLQQAGLVTMTAEKPTIYSITPRGVEQVEQVTYDELFHKINEINSSPAPVREKLEQLTQLSAQAASI